MAILPRYLRMRRRDWRDPFSWFQWYHQNQGPEPLFTYHGNNDPTAFGGAFSRASDATYLDGAGIVKTAASGVPRFAHYDPSNLSLGPLLLLEGSRANLAPYSAAIYASWTTSGTPSGASGTNTACGISLDTLSDDSAAQLQGFFETVAFTGDAVKAVSLIVKKGTSTSSVVRGRDATAPAIWLLATITWSGTVPSVAMTTGTHLGSQALADGCYRLLFTTAAVTAANASSLQIWPATDAALSVGGTGNILVGGVQAENATFPSSYIPTVAAAVTRAADALSFPFLPVPQAMTVLADAVDLGTFGATTYGVFDIGGYPSSNSLIGYNQGSRLTGEWVGASGAKTSQSSPFTQVLSSRAELLISLTSAGVVTASGVYNGTAYAGAAAAASALSSWNANTLLVGQVASGTPGFLALRSLKICAGVQTLQKMRGLM